MGYNSDGVITAPVNTDDVNAVVNVGSHFFDDLCTSPKINKASIFCPRRCTVPDLVLDNAGFAVLAGQISDRPNTRYACPKYGVWVPSLALNNLTPSRFSQLFDSSRDTWYIARPDAKSFMCIDHFHNYYHKARVTAPIIQSTVSKRSAGGYTVTMVLQTPAPDGRTLSVSNLFGGAGWYFGVIILRGENKEGWTQRDEWAVQGSGTAIKNDMSTAVEIKYNDTTADNSKVYYYRVIPFVCNKANVDTGKLSEGTFYGLRITDDCTPYYEIRTSGSGTSIGSGDDAVVQYANFKDVAHGEYYPNPARTSFAMYLPTPDIAIAYSEIAEDYYKYNPSKGMPYYNRLLNKYSRIEFHFSVYRFSSGGATEFIYTWRREGFNPDDTQITRDARFDNSGGDRENELLFYCAQHTFWDAIKTQFGGDSGLQISDMFGRFYFKDSLGHDKIEDIWFTEIPDLDE